MKKMLRSAGALLVCSALLTPAAQAYLTVYGNGTATASATGTTYSTAPTAANFWKPTGDYYVGLAVASTNNFTIGWTNYRTPNVTPVLTAIGSDATLSTAGTGLGISVMTLCNYTGDSKLPTVIAATAAGTAGGNILRALNKTNTTVGSTAILNDSAGAATTTSGIKALAAGSVPNATPIDTVYAAVLATGGGNFGDTGSGVNGGLVTRTAGASGISMCDVRAGQGAITAGGRATTCDVTAATGIFAQVDDATNVAGQIPALYFDPLIGTTGTLFVGQQLTAGNVGATDRAISVGFFHPTATATTLTLVNAAPAFAIADANVNSIIITSRNAAVTAAILKTMHTSTGLTYLIVNGGNGLIAATNNQVYAIPLVNGVGTAADGTPAKVTSFTNNQYQVQATAAGDLYSSTTPAVKVGNGLAPIAAGSGALSDMHVDGDTVYIAINVAGATTTGAGVYSSQACFNSLGQIDHWTDWRKVIPNDMGLAADGTQGRVGFVAVDGYTGHVFATSNVTNFWTNVTQWAEPTGTPTTQPYLAAAVNTALSNQCYSVVDLNPSTTGWGHTVVQRITAFGGEEKVCFAVTGSSSQATNAAVIALTTNTGVDLVTAGDSYYDYTNATGGNVMFYTSSLPAGAGAVVALGYTGWDADGTTSTTATSGFFLAGCAGTAATAPGLYVFANATTGVGINPTLFTGLGNTTFPASYSWQKVSNISGMPVKIQANGGGLHVLTRTATLDRIYSCSKQVTLSGLNTSFVVTASSGVAPTAGSANSSLATVQQIYDFVISVSATPSNTNIATSAEQLLMLTNDGIYTTSSTQGMQAISTNLSQLNAGWVRIDASSTTMTTLGFFADYLGQPNYNRNPQTFWFANFSANAAGIYNKNIMYQMNRVNLIANAPLLSTYVEDPSNTVTFNGVTSPTQTTAPTIYTNFPVLSRLFYSDGARRFFIQKSATDDTQYQVLVLPFNLTSYGITTDGKAAMADTVVAQAGAFYWMQEIGTTGRLMMGTSKGVIALQ